MRSLRFVELNVNVPRLTMCFEFAPPLIVTGKDIEVTGQTIQTEIIRILKSVK